MKRFEKLCIDYSQRYKKNWDNFIIASDAYLSGYKKAREECIKAMTTQDLNFGPIAPAELFVGEEFVEIEFRDGEHQLSTHTQSPDVELKKLLKAQFGCEDIKVHTSNNTISFQGTFKT